MIFDCIMILRWNCPASHKLTYASSEYMVELQPTNKQESYWNTSPTAYKYLASIDLWSTSSVLTFSIFICLTGFAEWKLYHNSLWMRVVWDECGLGWDSGRWTQKSCSRKWVATFLPHTLIIEINNKALDSLGSIVLLAHSLSLSFYSAPVYLSSSA